MRHHSHWVGILKRRWSHMRTLDDLCISSIQFSSVMWMVQYNCDLIPLQVFSLSFPSTQVALQRSPKPFLSKNIRAVSLSRINISCLSLAYLPMVMICMNHRFYRDSITMQTISILFFRVYIDMISTLIPLS